jgi:hypothetical protein
VADPAPARLPFRFFAGLLAFTAAAVCIAAIYEQFEPDPKTAADRAWLGLLAVSFGFAARWLGWFTFTGLPPPRPPPSAWRTAFDALFGVTATVVVMVAVYAVVTAGSTTAATVWRVALLLAFVRGFRWYWERGAASVRGRKAQR